MKLPIVWRWFTLRDDPSLPNEIELPDELVQLALRADILICNQRSTAGKPEGLMVYLDEPGGKMRQR